MVTGFSADFLIQIIIFGKVVQPQSKSFRTFSLLPKKIEFLIPYKIAFEKDFSPGTISAVFR